MHRSAGNGSLTHWLRLVLVLGVVVAAWGPAHSAAAVAGSAPAHPVGSHADATHDSHGDREPGGRGGHRCGHSDFERDATHATSVRLFPPGVVSAPMLAAPGQSRPGLADAGLAWPRPAEALWVAMCVWRQ